MGVYLRECSSKPCNRWKKITTIWDLIVVLSNIAVKIEIN